MWGIISVQYITCTPFPCLVDHDDIVPFSDMYNLKIKLTKISLSERTVLLIFMQMFRAQLQKAKELKEQAERERNEMARRMELFEQQHNETLKGRPCG